MELLLFAAVALLALGWTLAPLLHLTRSAHAVDPEVAVRRCRTCGVAVPQSSRFCSNCGREAEAQPAPPP